MTTEAERERLLETLNAYGQQFLGSFDIPGPSKNKGKLQNAVHESDSEEEEWTGFASAGSEIGSDDQDEIAHTAAYSQPLTGFDQGDDGFTAGSSRTPDVLVFSEPRGKPPETQLSTKELRKSFMSPKVTNITTLTEPTSTRMKSQEDLDDERTNSQNDALLHRLIHTKLLSGSLNPELNLNHAQREKALGGRVLELSGNAKLGKGEGAFRAQEHNKAAKHLREGLLRKKREDEEKSLKEAKNLGNYHPTLKRLYDSNLSSGPPKKRARGLGMGVGKFVGGTLKLSRDEIASVMGSGKRSRQDSRPGRRISRR